MPLLFCKHTRHIADRKSLNERGCGTLLDCPIIPFGAENCIIPTSAKDKSHLHQFGTKDASRFVHRNSGER